MLFSSRIRVRVRIRFNVWLVSGYAHVFVLPSAVTVTPPYTFFFTASRTNQKQTETDMRKIHNVGYSTDRNSKLIHIKLGRAPAALNFAAVLTQVGTPIGYGLRDRGLEIGGFFCWKMTIKRAKSTTLCCRCSRFLCLKCVLVSASVQSISYFFVFQPNYRRKRGLSTVGACAGFCSGTNQRLEGRAS